MRTIPLIALLGLALAGPAAAEFTPMATAVPDSVPNGMNYQGRLEKDGFPVTGTRSMTFRLYDASTGGTALYTSGILAIPVQQGLFAANLDIPFGSLTGTAQKYLEIEVEGIVLSPRDPLRSVPYAKVAETVEGIVNISTAGLTFTTNVGDSLAISSQSGRVGVGTSVPLARLHVSSGAGETGNIVLVSTGASNILIVDGNGRVTANAFDGDGTPLRNVVRRTGDSMSGPLTLNASTLTVLGSEFSVGTNQLFVGGAKVGVLTATPLAVLSVVGDSSFSQPATFGASVTVVGAAHFGTGATRSSITAGGDVILHTNSSLTVGSTFFVGNTRTGIGTAAPTTKLEVNGDAQFGAGAVKSTFSTTGSLAMASGANVVMLGGGRLSGLPTPAAGDEAATKNYVNAVALSSTGWTRDTALSFVMLTNVGDKVGVGVTNPPAKLTVVGDLGVTQQATFGASVTVKAAAAFGTTGQSDFGATGVLTLGTPLAAGSGGTGNVNGTAAALTSNPTDCGANQFANTIAANGNLTCAAIVDADVPDTITINAAAALAANPTDCGANQFANTIAANGNLTCAAIADADVPDGITITLAAAASALAANPSDCGANQFANTIAANGNLTCAAIADADVPDSITVNATAVAAGSLPTTVIAQTVQAAGATRLFSRTIPQLLAITPAAVGEIYYCNDCAPLKVVVSTGTAIGNFAAIDGGAFQ